MEKQIGKLYSRIHNENRNGKNTIYRMVIMCTDVNKNNNKTISGVVVDQTDEFSDFQIGSYSSTWTFVPGFYEEYVGEIRLNNENWKDINKNSGTCC